jgi:hypothetical protein
VPQHVQMAYVEQVPGARRITDHSHA